MATLMTKYANLVNAKLRNALVLKDGVIFNTRYEGNPLAGTVKVRKTGAATVADYNRATGADLTVDTDGYIDVAINKDKVVNELIDGFEAAAVADGIVADRLDAAAYALANALDVDGAAELVSGGTTLDDTDALTSATVYDSLVDARTAMVKAGVPNDGRMYVIVAPEVMGLILKSDDFTKASALGDSVIATGAIGKIAGFLVFESANLGDDVEYVAGHPDYAARVKMWKSEPHIQDLNGSGKYVDACAVQGRYIYGHKVTSAGAILVKTANF